MGRGGVACPKPEPRKKAKDRKLRLHRTHVHEVRDYVFMRERNLCRCCRARAAHSMHELVFRSLGGSVSRRNRPMTELAASHLKIKLGEAFVSAPMREIPE